MWGVFMDSAFKRVIKSLFMIFICGILFFLTVFTWFQKEDDISSNVDLILSSDSLSLSVDQKSWNNTLTNSDFSHSFILSSRGVSTTFTVNEKGEIPFYQTSQYSLRESDYLLAKKIKNNQILSFDFYVKSSKEQILTLTSLSSLHASVENYIRVGVVSDSFDKVIWEPYKDIHNETGVKRSLLYYDVITNRGLGGVKIDTRGIKKSVTKEDKILLYSKNEDVFESVSTSEIIDSSMNCFPIKKGITKITVYLWLESQDVDYVEDSYFEQIPLLLQFGTLELN